MTEEGSPKTSHWAAIGASKALQKLKHEFFEVLPPTIFFFVAFQVITVTKTLMLREHGIPFSGFAVDIRAVSTVRRAKSGGESEWGGCTAALSIGVVGGSRAQAWLCGL